MNFSETFDKLTNLIEGGAGGQRTYKDFLLYLAKFLGCDIPANYEKTWVLHHRDCNHFNNEEFSNLVLMNPAHHISFHVQLAANKKNADEFLKTGTTKNGDKFEYWLIGDAIAARINMVQTEPDISEITS